MSKLIIVDGNSLLFRAFYALYTINPTNIMRTSDGVPTNAIYIFSNMLASLLSSLKDGDGIFVAFDAGKHTFRHKEFADYKANRPKCPEELLEQMPIAREFLDELNILHYENENLEADDICGIMANNAAKEGYDVEIYTSDKDYLQLINDKITIELIRKGLKDIHRMDREAFINEWGIEPIQICDYKGLRGDDSDNLKGIPGIGDKTAKLLISKFGDLENIIKNADLKTKVGKNLVEYQDQGRLCKHLAIIATNESIPLTPSDTIYKGYDFSKISNFALKYQFRTLLNKLPKRYKLEKKVANVIDFTENLDYSDILNAKEIGLAIDIEKLNYHDARLFGIAITTQNNTYYIHYESLIKDLKILDLLNNKDVKKFTFDYKKILCVFARYNIKVDGLYFDLLLANYLLDSNSKADIESLLISKGIDISYALKNENLLFDDSHIKLTAITSYYSLNLFDDYKENLKAKNQLDLLYDIEMPLTIVLAKMEIEGFPLDKDTLLTFKDDFQKKVDSLRDKYDFIFIDVPPTISLPNDTAFYACDQIIVVLQTQERSLQGAEVLIEYLQNSIVDAYDSKVDILGILPFLSKRSASVDKEILDAASEEFGDENIFNAKIMQMERVKRMDMTGITDNPSDSWDKKTHAAFKGVANEILERLGEE